MTELHSDNVGDFIVETLSQIRGFDFSWSSLISNNPLLFNDLDYVRIKRFIDDKITDEELQAYKENKLTEIYPTFDSLLICNLRYYDRIINYCTMVLMGYYTVDDDKIVCESNLELSLTPTKIWCAVLSNVNSTAWELNYVWRTPQMKKDIVGLRDNFQYLNNNNINFKNFHGLNALRLGVDGFRNQWSIEDTTNNKLAVVTDKFTNSSMACSTQDIEKIYDYYMYLCNDVLDLEMSLNSSLLEMFKKSESYGTYIFNDEFFVITVKFGLSCKKTNERISKDYFSNSYGCLIAESGLSNTIPEQIKWAKSKQELKYQKTKNLLCELLFNMLDGQGYKTVLCLRKTSINGVHSIVRFSGVFNNVKISESFYNTNSGSDIPLKITEKILSKRNASMYLIERGYVLFGDIDDVNLMIKDDVIKHDLVKHFSKYIINVKNMLNDVIILNKKYVNDVIDVYLGEEKQYHNDEILMFNMAEINHAKMLGTGIKRQKNGEINTTIWQAFTD